MVLYRSVTVDLSFRFCTQGGDPVLHFNEVSKLSMSGFRHLIFLDLI